MSALAALGLLVAPLYAYLVAYVAGNAWAKGQYDAMMQRYRKHKQQPPTNPLH